MKNLFLLSVIICFLFNTHKTNAQVYTIPWAQVQPEWVFPLWFEDATGARDTLYLSYDSNSGDPFNNAFDSIYGDNYLVPLDTSKFQAYFGCSLSTDLLVQNSICSKIEFLTPDICFINCQLPLIMRWDVNMFRSNALPFPDQSPAPRAQGLLWFDLPFNADDCGFSQPVLLTDTTINNNPPPLGCLRRDSILFYNPFGNGVSYLMLSIRQWTGIYLHILPIQKKNIGVFPNPANNSITITNINGFDVEIYDVLGRNIITKYKTTEVDTTLDITTLNSGIYFIQIIDTATMHFQTIKFIKQ